MKAIAILMSIYIALLSCSVTKATSANIESTDLGTYIRVISDVDITATIGEKNYTYQELKNGIENIKYGTEITLKTVDGDDYEWRSFRPDGSSYGETPSYDSTLSFRMMKDLVIVVK